MSAAAAQAASGGTFAVVDWGNPQDIYNWMMRSQTTAPFEDLERASRRLLEIDPIPVRAITARAVLLRGAGRLDEARAELEEAIQHLPMEAILHLNLAQVINAAGDPVSADERLWRSLELDPNFPLAVDIWMAGAKSDEDSHHRLKQLVDLPKSWLARFMVEGMPRIHRGEAPDPDGSLKTLLVGRLADESMGSDEAMALIRSLVGIKDPTAVAFFAGRGNGAFDPRVVRGELSQLYADQGAH